MSRNNPDFDIEAELEELRQQLKNETSNTASPVPQHKTPVKPIKKQNNFRPKFLTAVFVVVGLAGAGILTLLKSQESLALSESKNLISTAEQIKDSSDIASLKKTDQTLKENISHLEKIPNLPGFAYQEAQTNLPSLRSNLNVLDQNIQALENLQGAEKLAMDASILVQKPPHPPQVWQQAKQKWQQAIGLLEAIPLMNSWARQAQNKLVNYRSSLAVISKRVELSEKALDFNNRGIEAAIKGDKERALKFLNLAIRLNPIAETYAGRGFVYVSQGNHQQAIKEYEAAIKLNPNYADAYLSRGLSYHKLGNYKQAIEDIDHVLQINSNHGRAYLDRAVLRDQIGLRIQAEDDLKKSVVIFTQAGDTNNLKLAQNLVEKWGVALTPAPYETKDENPQKGCEDWQWQSNYPSLPCYIPAIEIRRKRKINNYPQPSLVQNDSTKTSNNTSSNKSSRSGRRSKKR